MLSLSVPADGTYLYVPAFDFILLLFGFLHIPLPSEKQRLGVWVEVRDNQESITESEATWPGHFLSTPVAQRVSLPAMSS